MNKGCVVNEAVACRTPGKCLVNKAGDSKKRMDHLKVKAVDTFVNFALNHSVPQFLHL